MEEDASKSQSSHHEDGPVTPNFLSRLAKDVKRLRKNVENILGEMKKDGNFSEMTEESYDEKKSYLTENLNELSRMHKALAGQISSTVRYSTPIGFYIALSRDCTVLCVSKSGESESSFLSSSDSGSISLTDDLGNENEEITEPQKKVAELDLKNTKIGEELEASKDKCSWLQVEKDQVKSQSSHHEDSHISPNFLVRLAKKVKGFQKLVKEILVEIEQDGNFSEITAERYDEKKSTLTRHLTELSRMHEELADEISTLPRYSTPIGLASVLSLDSSGFCVSKTEDSKCSVSLSSDYDSETLISTNKLLISPVKDDAQKDKETKAPEALLQKNSSDDLGNEKATVIELQKEVADLKHALSDSNLKNKKLEEELKTSNLRVTLSDKVIQGLKQQRSTQDSKESQMEKHLDSVMPLLDRAKKETDSYGKRIHEVESELSLYGAKITERKNQIAELKKTNKQYTSELSNLKSTYKTKENNWETSVGNLRKELEAKSESVADLNKKLDIARAEKCSRDDLIQEQEARLIASSENAQKVTDELTERVLKLEREVEMQKVAISVRDEQKEEVIRQISCALEHYKSR